MNWIPSTNQTRALASITLQFYSLNDRDTTGLARQHAELASGVGSCTHTTVDRDVKGDSRQKTELASNVNSCTLTTVELLYALDQ